jgi:hypothetical protein
MSLLQLFDKGFDIGCDCLFRGLRLLLLLLLKVLDKGADGGCGGGDDGGIHGWFLLFLNGCAVFAPKHALAMAHAIEGGKCKVWEKWPSGQPQAGGSEYLELHGAFSIALRAPGAALLSRFGFLAGRGAREIAFVFVVAFQPIRDGVAGRTQARRGGWRRTRTRPQTGGRLPPSKHHGLSVCLSFAFIVRIL